MPTVVGYKDWNPSWETLWLTVCYGKSPCLISKSTFYGHFHYQQPNFAVRGWQTGPKHAMFSWGQELTWITPQHAVNCVFRLYVAMGNVSKFIRVLSISGTLYCHHSHDVSIQKKPRWESRHCSISSKNNQMEPNFKIFISGFETFKDQKHQVQCRVMSEHSDNHTLTWTCEYTG